MTTYLNKKTNAPVIQRFQETNKDGKNFFHLAAENGCLQLALNWAGTITGFTSDIIDNMLGIPDHHSNTPWHALIKNATETAITFNQKTLTPKLAVLQTQTEGRPRYYFLAYTARYGTLEMLTSATEWLKDADLLEEQISEESILAATSSGDTHKLNHMLNLEIDRTIPPPSLPGEETVATETPAKTCLVELLKQHLFFQLVMRHGDIHMLDTITSHMEPRHWLAASQQKTRQNAWHVTSPIKPNLLKKLADNPFTACGLVIEYINTKRGFVREQLLHSFENMLDHYATSEIKPGLWPTKDNNFKRLLVDANTIISAMPGGQAAKATLSEKVRGYLSQRLKPEESNASSSTGDLWAIPMARIANNTNRARSFASYRHVSTRGGGGGK